MISPLSNEMTDQSFFRSTLVIDIIWQRNKYLKKTIFIFFENIFLRKWIFLKEQTRPWTSTWPKFPSIEKWRSDQQKKNSITTSEFLVCGGRIISNSFFNEKSQSWDALTFLSTTFSTFLLQQSDKRVSDKFRDNIDINKKVNQAECNKLHRILLFTVSESLKVNFIFHPIIREHLFVWIPPRPILVSTQIFAFLTRTNIRNLSTFLSIKWRVQSWVCFNV